MAEFSLFLGDLNPLFSRMFVRVLESPPLRHSQTLFPPTGCIRTLLSPYVGIRDLYGGGASLAPSFPRHLDFGLKPIIFCGGWGSDYPAMFANKGAE